MSTLSNTRISGLINAGYVYLYITDCPTCGVVYAFSTDYEKRRREDGKSWSCPNGHSGIYFGESDAATERKARLTAERQRDAARIARDAARDQAEAAHRSANAYKGHITRREKQIANGVWPVPSSVGRARGRGEG